MKRVLYVILLASLAAFGCKSAPKPVAQAEGPSSEAAADRCVPLQTTIEMSCWSRRAGRRR